jgi:hypothetical protein
MLRPDTSITADRVGELVSARSASGFFNSNASAEMKLNGFVFSALVIGEFDQRDLPVTGNSAREKSSAHIRPRLSLFVRDG